MRMRKLPGIQSLALGGVSESNLTVVTGGVDWSNAVVATGRAESVGVTEPKANVSAGSVFGLRGQS